ncbi:PilN domain-containing protein [Tardiphaga sp.]|uniref:PilN domain-containing protein n=1 Tax=Tardiphaga sp. TaxID=1926292 RepID=UPI00352B733F
MLKAVKASLRWLVDGLSEAVTAGVVRFDRRPAFQIDLAADNTVFDAHHRPLGRLVAGDAALRFEPPSLAAQLAGSSIDIELPTAWVWRRHLQPIGIDNVAYLDAFVSHHIERISPWRATDVYHQIISRPMLDDSKRVAVEVGIVPRSAVDRIVAMLAPLAARLQLVSRRADDREALIIPVAGKDNTQRNSIRRMVVMALVLVAVAIAGWFASVQWGMADIDAELVELDQQMIARKAQLAAGRGSSGQTAAETLRIQRASRPYVVELVDAMSQILPDHAYLVDLRFEKDLIRVSGISARSFELVPALERSGRFTDVKYTAATTRLEDGRTDRFHLEMRAADAPGAAR